MMLNFFDNFTELKSLVNTEGFCETGQIIIFIFTSKSTCISYISNKELKEAIGPSHPISCSVIWENIQNKHIRSPRDENDFDFILHHVCSCSHEECDHIFDIMDPGNERCCIDGCYCSRIVP